MNTSSLSVDKQNIPAIVAESLSIFYGERSVLHDLSISIPFGAKCHIAGVNGSGKSSLLRCLAGIQRPSEGCVRVGDCDLSSRLGFASYKRSYAPVFLEEQDAFYPMLSVRENIAFANSYSGEKASTALSQSDSITLLDKLELKKYLDHTPVKLSRGERRRLSLLLVLLGSPKLLFLDEPFVSLDTRSQEIFSNVLSELDSEQTLLLVSHNKPLADSICESSLSLDAKGGR